jgi:hypothetical protein
MIRLSGMIRNDFGVQWKVKNGNENVEEHGERNDRRKCNEIQTPWKKRTETTKQKVDQLETYQVP